MSSIEYGENFSPYFTLLHTDKIQSNHGLNNTAPLCAISDVFRVTINPIHIENRIFVWGVD